MHKCSFKERFEIIDGQITRIVTAYYKDETLDVLMENENGSKVCRNIYFVNIWGYGIAFPGEWVLNNQGAYGNYYIEEAEEWGECNINTEYSILDYWQKPTERNIRVITDKYPNFKSVIEKWKPRNCERLFRAFVIWKDNKEIGKYLSLGAERLAFGKSIYRSRKYQKILEQKSKAMTRKELKHLSIADLQNFQFEVDYPDFKYVIKKWTPYSHKDLMRAKAMFKKHTDVEFLLAMGFEKLAFDEDVYNCGIPKKDMYRILAEYKDVNINNKNELMLIYKYHLTPTEFGIIGSNGWILDTNEINKSRKLFDYIINQNCKGHKILATDYADYLGKCRSLKVNLDDNYWCYPTDFEKKYELIKRQYEESMENIKKETLEAIARQITEKEIDGYKVYVPSNMESIKRQAESLNQCLVRCNYVKSVVEKKDLLIFLEEKGKPVATAEIKADLKIHQFYGDERARDIYPSARAKKALNKYLMLNNNNIRNHFSYA